MLRPPVDIYQQLARVATHYPQVVEWLGEWGQQELESLPQQTENVARAQGRCAVLRELYKLLKESPDKAATGRPRTP